MNKQNQTTPKVFTTIDGNSLIAQEYEPLQFAIEKILPHGLFVFAGSPKVGKSWQTLDMCQAIATGGKLWEFAATQGNALYLALEDKYSRLQGRLIQMKADNLDISRLHLATASFGMQNGLFEQVHNFIAAYPDTNIIAIDTLERIRDSGRDREHCFLGCFSLGFQKNIFEYAKIRVVLIVFNKHIKNTPPNASKVFFRT